MDKELERLLGLADERHADQIESLLFRYQREKLPTLPKYDGYRQGYEETFRKDHNPNDLRTGLKVAGSISAYRHLIVLEPDGLFAVPNIKGENNKVRPDWSKMRPLTPKEIIRHERDFFKQIDTWSVIFNARPH